jgi:hypothetical protein
MSDEQPSGGGPVCCPMAVAMCGLGSVIVDRGGRGEAGETDSCSQRAEEDGAAKAEHGVGFVVRRRRSPPRRARARSHGYQQDAALAVVGGAVHVGRSGVGRHARARAATGAPRGRALPVRWPLPPRAAPPTGAGGDNGIIIIRTD